MASIVLLLSELLGGESASVLAAERYMGGHQTLRELRPAVTGPQARPTSRTNNVRRPPAPHGASARRRGMRSRSRISRCPG
ncbi:unnamed protein product [Miscanthus lutarioriparius]|uniref:Uncharacterized protein n=1 Tax=Miscanthus lutarioriparius TaxID=422564 RepID=A0A811PH15_9POAL|nr:unnamed protein product [Miscanthus lutarioriparius]